MNQLFEELQSELERAAALKSAMNLFEWDTETLAPVDADKNTAKTVGILSTEHHDILASDKVKKLLKKLIGDTSLNDMEKAVVREAAWNAAWMEAVPAKEFKAYAELEAESGRIWSRARAKKDFSMFAPTLEKIIDYERKFASYRAAKGESLYDTMLKAYEKEFNTEHLDQFFKELKEELVPLLKRVNEGGRKIDDSFLKGDFPEEQQRELAEWVAAHLGFDFDGGVLAVSAHPFTTALHNHDVRITTHYTDNISHSLYSVIHEAGHGIYEMGIDDEITQTILGEGASMAMHESQSRFFENVVGKHPAFLGGLFEKIKEIFPKQFDGVSLKGFLDAVNKVTPGPIRIEADELTYSLHILIRYEIEKMLINDELAVSELPKIWNEKYEEYLGITPKDDAEGVLQDVHWSGGAFGYFPSYALGSAYSAQIYYYMKDNMNFDELLEQGKLEKVRDYLKEHIYRFGMQKTGRELMVSTTGEEFNPKYYIRYLKEKYEVFT